MLVLFHINSSLKKSIKVWYFICNIFIILKLPLFKLYLPIWRSYIWKKTWHRLGKLSHSFKNQYSRITFWWNLSRQTTNLDFLKETWIVQHFPSPAVYKPPECSGVNYDTTSLSSASTRLEQYDAAGSFFSAIATVSVLKLLWSCFCSSASLVLSEPDYKNAILLRGKLENWWILAEDFPSS